MLRSIFLIWVVAFITFLMLTASCQDCPEGGVARGQFEIETADAHGYPPPGYWREANGTIEIREDEVEIVYQDEAGETWTVLYDIVEEFPAGEGGE